jgi:hypothetical protein
MRKLSLLFAVFLVTYLVFSVSCLNSEVQVTETYYETEYRTESYVEIGQEHQEYLTPKWERLAPIYFTELEWAKSGAESSIHGYELNTTKLSKSQVRLVLSNNPQASLWGIEVINLTGIGPLSEPPPQSGLAFEQVVEGEMKYMPPAAEQQWADDLEALLIDPGRCLCAARSDQYTCPDITFNASGVEEFAIVTCTPPHWLVSAGPVVQKVQLISCEEVAKERQVPYQVGKQRTVTKTEKIPFWEIIFGK